ncbi:hypothetical protein YC2023_030845 [Brassica napus]
MEVEQLLQGGFNLIELSSQGDDQIIYAKSRRHGNSSHGIQKPAWLDALYAEKFFVGCPYHETAKKNEKNVCCLDCCISLCPHCVPSHRYHRLLQVRRYVYHDVVRLEDLQRLIDCSNVQWCSSRRDHKIDNSKELATIALHVTEVFKNLLSIAPWVVEFVMKSYGDITPFLKPCHSLTLGPDYIIPQDLLADDDMAAYETPRSTVVDGDESMSWSSTSSELRDAATTTHVVRKKRTGFCFCAKSANSYKAVSEDPDDISACINRRKGIPQRSPLSKKADVALTVAVRAL